MSARQDWLAERERIPGVGASEAAALFGLHPNISAFSLFEKLVNPKPPTDEELEEEADVKSFGLAIEPYLADWYARKTGRYVGKPAAPGVLRLPQKPYIFASPDRYIWDPPGVLELKSAIYFRRDEPLPDYWQVQCQQLMMCTATESASFAILGGFRRRYRVDDIPLNRAFCDILVETIDRFMLAVQEGSWGRWGGDIDGSHATREALRRLYPNESGTVAPLSERAFQWATNLSEVQGELKNLHSLEDELKNKLRAEIGEHSYGAFLDGSGYSLKTIKGSTYTVVKEDYRTLRRVKRIPKGLLQT